jgi:DNA-directed RNA polymerase specialized sigma24 family protein
MTREEYGAAYQRGFNLTVRFLVSRGLSYDAAQETAQAAWAKGWERLGQLRDSNMVLTWMNSIALNIHRSYIRREPLLQTLPELSTSPKINLAAIDVRRILKCCKHNDRMVLQRHYLEGIQGSGDRDATGVDRDGGPDPAAAGSTERRQAHGPKDA